MNRDTDPYTPPSVIEPELDSVRYWRVDGIDVFAKNGATLPPVDLLSGVRDEPLLRGVPRVYQGVGVWTLIRIALVLAAILVVPQLPGGGSWLVFVVLMGMIFLQRLGILGGKSSARMTIWTYVERARLQKAAFRRRLRIGLMLLVFALMVASLFFPITVDSILREGFFLGWLHYLLPSGLFVILALSIWARIDQPKPRLHAVALGWLRLSPIHPEALAFLRGEEEKLDHRGSPDDTSRKRLVRTIFYHRFPLRMLVGNRMRNPWVLLQCALMKFLRSKLLVREIYDSSEAADIPLEHLDTRLRDAIGGWLADHPDWIPVESTSLTAPAGDLTVQNAVLASPGLEHCAIMTRAWLAARPDRGAVLLKFLTRLEDGTHVSTHDHPFLALTHPHQHHQAAGGPEQIHQAHLGHLAGLPLAPHADVEALKAWLKHEREEAERLQTEAGLQSPPRVASA